MKLIYLADIKNKIPNVDKDILFSLKKKAEVKVLDIRTLDIRKSIKHVLGADVFLFHGQMGDQKGVVLYQMIENLKLLLEGTNSKKILWFFDKIWMDKMSLLLQFYNSVDYIFVSDATWTKRFESEKIFPLHPAASERKIKGKFKKEFACDIAILGNVYGQRQDEAKFIKDKFGGRVKFFNDKFGRDLADLCKSAKIILVQKYPFDDFFWSDRIYKILGYGGFCLHPRTYGLQEQGLKDGVHFVDYNTEQDLHSSIGMLLDKRADKYRKYVAKQGQTFVLNNHTYKNRVEEILKQINETKSIS